MRTWPISFCLSFSILAPMSDSQVTASPPAITPEALREETASEPRQHFRKRELVVTFYGDLSPEDPWVTSFDTKTGWLRLGYNPTLHQHLYRIKEGQDLSFVLRELRQTANVRSAEPNFFRYPHRVPNDSFYRNSPFPTDQQRWAFHGTGVDRNLSAELAWDLSTGRSDVVIAVIDSGTDLDHPDLLSNLWTNPGEIPGNGIDEDQNGFVDDVHGYDFQAGDPDPEPDLGDGLDNDGVDGPDSNVAHGTFVASILGARGDNAIGLAGAAWACQIMSLKVLSDDGGATDFDIASAISYAANEGADVINISLGSPVFSQTLQSAVDLAWLQGAVLIASAGNENSPAPVYPAAFAHVISVGSTDSGSIVNQGSGDIDGRAGSSAFGNEAVDVVAPGVHIFGATVGSTANGSPGIPGYSVDSGTSFAAPFVSGLCALLFSYSRDQNIPITNVTIETILRNTADNLPDDPDDAPDAGEDWDHYGRVNFHEALLAVDLLPQNQAPVAVATGPSTGAAGDTLTFDGSNSMDPDMDPIMLTWTFGDGTLSMSGELVDHMFSTPGDFLVTLTASDGVLIDTDVLLVTIEETPLTDLLLFLTFEQDILLPEIGKISPEDIVVYVGETSRYQILFDGSDVGILGGDIDGLSQTEDGDLLLSFSRQTTLPQSGNQSPGKIHVTDADIVRFTPLSLGATTSGLFSLYFDGSDVGLGEAHEGIDALSLQGGNLYLSTRGPAIIPGLGAVGGEDIVQFIPSTLGENTTGVFLLHFDGSDVELSEPSENIDALSFGPLERALYLSPLGSLSTTGFSAEKEDGVRFYPRSLEPFTDGLFLPLFRGQDLLIPSQTNVNGLSVALH